MRDNLSKRPRIDVPRTGWDYVAEALALAGVVIVVLLPILVWSDLPDQVPRHFRFGGSPTAWADRGFIIFPSILAVILYLGMTLLGRIPHYFNYPTTITERNAATMYRLGRSMVIWLKALVVWMFVVILWGQARVALDEADGINPAAMIFVLVAIHVVLGVFFYRTYKQRGGDDTTYPSEAPDSH